MLKRLHIQNFTVFADADFEFGPGLNVLVGTNGTGKSHVLKLGYALLVSRDKVKNRSFTHYPIEVQASNLRWVGNFVLDLAGVFAIRDYKLLVFKQKKLDALINAEFEATSEYNETVFFEIGATGTLGLLKGGEVIGEQPKVVAPIFIPAKEILTLGWILAAANQLLLPIETNYLHLLTQLQWLPQRQPAAAEAIQTLARILGGEVSEENGKYYLNQTDGQRLEMNMVAEGLRKFGTLQKLLANGSLTKAATLFWDEPEANLNPALLRELAQVLAELARQGFQIILATHSIGLLKQFHILSREKREQHLPIRYFGLNAAPGEATTVTTVNDFELLPNIVALDVELEQADDLEAIFAREDQAQ